eukprot:490097-Rhodomonas_salina.4
MRRVLALSPPTLPPSTEPPFQFRDTSPATCQPRRQKERRPAARNGARRTRAAYACPVISTRSVSTAHGVAGASAEVPAATVPCPRRARS